MRFSHLSLKHCIFKQNILSHQYQYKTHRLIHQSISPVNWYILDRDSGAGNQITIHTNTRTNTKNKHRMPYGFNHCYQTAETLSLYQKTKVTAPYIFGQINQHKSVGFILHKVYFVGLCVYQCITTTRRNTHAWTKVKPGLSKLRCCMRKEIYISIHYIYI